MVHFHVCENCLLQEIYSSIHPSIMKDSSHKIKNKLKDTNSGRKHNEDDAGFRFFFRKPCALGIPTLLDSLLLYCSLDYRELIYSTGIPDISTQKHTVQLATSGLYQYKKTSLVSLPPCTSLVSLPRYNLIVFCNVQKCPTLAYHVTSADTEFVHTCIPSKE